MAATAPDCNEPERNGALMFRPHPFSWVPAEGQRHATTDPKPRQGYHGVVVRTLCFKKVTVDNSDVGWLWPTCPSCNTGAHDLAGVPKAADARVVDPEVVDGEVLEIDGTD